MKTITIQAGQGYIDEDVCIKFEGDRVLILKDDN